MKKIFNLFIVMIISVTLLSCVKEVVDEPAPINVTVIDSSKNYVTVVLNGDTVSVRVTVEGDSISFYNEVNIEGDSTAIDNHLHNDNTLEGDNINVNGGDNNSNSSDNHNTTVVTKLANGFLITVKDPNKLSTNLHSPSQWTATNQLMFLVDETLRKRSIRDVSAENPNAIVVSSGFYDGSTSDCFTSLSFHSHFMGTVMDEIKADGSKVGLKISGKFGAQVDREEDLAVLFWKDDVWNILPAGKYPELELPASSYNYIVGFDGRFGKSAGEVTGRTLAGFNRNGELLILVVKDKHKEAWDQIHELGARGPIINLLAGGSSQIMGPGIDDPIINSDKECPLFLLID